MQNVLSYTGSIKTRRQNPAQPAEYCFMHGQSHFASQNKKLNYTEIENMMAISALFDISIDELLSNEKGAKFELQGIGL